MAHCGSQMRKQVYCANWPILVGCLLIAVYTGGVCVCVCVCVLLNLVLAMRKVAHAFLTCVVCLCCMPVLYACVVCRCCMPVLYACVECLFCMPVLYALCCMPVLYASPGLGLRACVVVCCQSVCRSGDFSAGHGLNTAGLSGLKRCFTC